MGGERTVQPDKILDNFSEEFCKLKIYNNRVSENSSEQSVHLADGDKWVTDDEGQEDVEEVPEETEEHVHVGNQRFNKNSRGKTNNRRPRFYTSRSNPAFRRQK